MQEFIQTIVNGLQTGFLYALIALGYTMVYGVLKLLNFAHGDVYMVGGYIGYFVIRWFGGASDLSIPVPLLLLIMFALAAGGGGLLFVGGEPRPYSAQSFIPCSSGIHFGDVSIDEVQILIFVVSVLMMYGL